MISLFDFEKKDISKVKGLEYIDDFIIESEESDLINVIDSQFWMTNLKRRVQHYGYEYDYKSKNIQGKFLGSLPNWVLPIVNKLSNQNLLTSKPDQLIINEYLPGQGISPHVDCIPCFADEICSISLGSDCVMDFINQEKIKINLKRRSLLLLKADARYVWKHGISPKLSDDYAGIKVLRKRRISLTFRKVL